MRRVLCLNGPNLDLLGRREPGVYGSLSLAELEERVRGWGGDLGLEVDCFQTNGERELIEAVHGSASHDGIIVNPGALTHTSFALRDAVAAVDIPVVEVHLSNVRHRDRWRRRSVLAGVAAATIFGRGAGGYRAALRHLVDRAACPFESHRYGPHPDQVFDLRAASGSRGGVLIHGGFWLDEWGRDTTEPWAVDLCRRGLPTANLEYRRLGSGGGVVPTVADVVEGVRAASGVLPEAPPVVIGHSAGAHLALAAASQANLAGLVLVSGVYDPGAPGVDRTGAAAGQRFDPDGSTRLDQLVTPDCPVLLVHGAADRVVPPDQSQTAAEALGAAAELVVCPEVGHFDALDPASEVWQSVVEWLRRLD